MVSDDDPVVNSGSDSAISAQALARLAVAASRGRLVVPVQDAKQSDRGLQLRLVEMEVALDAEPSRTVFAVFTSEDAMESSGLPAAMPHGTPLVEDLGALIGPEAWVMVDPASAGAMTLQVAALVGLLDGMRRRGTAHSAVHP